MKKLLTAAVIIMGMVGCESRPDIKSMTIRNRVHLFYGNTCNALVDKALLEGHKTKKYDSAMYYSGKLDAYMEISNIAVDSCNYFSIEYDKIK